MAYFIHNKYDSNSSSQVTNVSGTDYTFNSDTAVTVIDYFGLLESGDETYKYLDTTYMGVQPISELAYTTIDTNNLIGNVPTTDGKSNIEYASGISKILDKLQIAVGEKTDTGGSESDGTVMAKLNALMSLISTKSSIKSIQKGKLDSKKTSSDPFIVKLPISVNTDKSFVIAHGFGECSSNESDTSSRPDWHVFPWVHLKSSTELEANGGDSVGNGSSQNTYYVKIYWQVIEFY